MARDFIKIDTVSTTQKYGTELVLFKDVLRDAYNRGKKILAVMGHANDGTVFSDIETLYGIPAGQGQAVFNMIGGAIGSMEGTIQVADAKTLTERLG